MGTLFRLAISWLGGMAFLAIPAYSQARPYIGYVYPAGGRQGSVFQVRMGGQNMDDVTSVLVSGTGVTVKIRDYYWRQSNQEQQLLNEQLQILKPAAPPARAGATPPAPPPPADKSEADPAIASIIDKIQRRSAEYVQTPASASIAALLFLEVSVAPDAEPGEREIRVVTARGVSNPLPFHIGKLPEYSRKPMRTAAVQVLGKEAQSLRKRPAEEAEDRVELPAVLNGQIASGEVNQYRFTARKGQRLLFATEARQLIPYIADAVPGWFQPVLVLSDAQGKEVAYDDDFRFKPDPTIFYQAPADGEYVLTIRDSLYRGREDFVYRITAGELPFVTSVFPLGGRVGKATAVQLQGWNLESARVKQPARREPGVYTVSATRAGVASNSLPFAVDTLPEITDRESNNDAKHAQKIKLPVVINGRIDRPGDWDVYRIKGKANEAIVIEVSARRLESPLDSFIKLTDVKGKVLAFNDDHEDIGSGLNTHHADSYLMTKLPADGNYFIHIGDTAQNGGSEYAYRLRISEPRPDFELRVVPSSIALRSRSANSVSVYVIRKDGFNSPIRLTLKDPPPGISSPPATIGPNQAVVRLTVRTTLASTPEPLALVVEGRATVGAHEILHQATPAEDRMQAFLWRHLAPAQTLQAIVFDPAYQAPPKRVAPPRPATPKSSATAASAAKPKFTQQQVTTRLRDLNRLYGAGYLTDEFYWEKIAECETPQ